MEEAIDVLCINCSEMVPADQVTVHSHRCQQVHPYVASMDNSEVLRLIDFKIEKLRLAIQMSLSTSLPKDSVQSMTSLSELAGQLLKNYGASSSALSLTESALSQLTAFTRDFHGSTSIGLYGERLKALAKDKAAELKQVLEPRADSGFVQQLSQKDEEIEKLRKELDEWKVRVQEPQRKDGPREAGTVLDEVKSEAGKVSRQSSQGSVNLAPESPLPKQHLSEVANMSQDDRKRYFFSQCLAIKLTFPMKSKAQFVKIPQLFEKANVQNVAVEDWPDFIRTELANA